MNDPWFREFKRYASFTQAQQIQWLNLLLFFISMFARDTYELGTDFVCKPIELRRFNELLHRISRKQMDVINNSKTIPDDIFFNMLADEIERLNIDNDSLIDRLSERRA
jgi:hypothetical protein